MIAKISRGWRAGGLVRYLMGPGRFNEHTNQHVVASWDGDPQRHQPQQRADGEFDVAGLVDELTEAAEAAGVAQTEPPRVAGQRAPRGPVWHCSLRNSATDRVLTDAEWAEVVEDLMDRTGIAARGDLGGCRWVAVRHADDHVHIAAVLVRQDNGRRVHPRNDYLRAREVCRDAEQRHGLSPTAPADRTAAEPATRAEQEKAVRRGETETSREWLGRAARIAAVQAQDPEEFFRRLADQGVAVLPREMPPGQLVGYAIAAPGDTNADGMPVWFAGRSLARDLSLPKLLERWASAPPPAQPLPPAAHERARVGAAERAEAIGEAISAVEHATAALAAGERDVAASVAHAAGDMLTAVCTVTGRAAELDRVRWEVAERFDRAVRTPGVGQPRRWAPVAAELRTAAWRLIALRAVAGSSSDSGVAQLAVALAALVAEIAAYRESQQCLVQAAAARHSADLLAKASRPPGRPGDSPTRGQQPGGRRARPDVARSRPGAVPGRPGNVDDRGKRR
jgi:hypothetical protein